MTPLVRRPSAWHLYLPVLVPSLVVVGLVATLAIGSVEVMGAVRAYVGGESLWSKARSEAVQHLRNYAINRDEADYQRYEAALRVPLGDRRAREGMSQAEPDRPAIRQGLQAGGIHPDDIDSMIALFRRFGDQSLFRGALDAWVTGDALIEQLQVAGQHLRSQIQRGEPPEALRPTLGLILQINEQLSTNERRFSASLATASRVTERALVISTGATAVLLSLISYLLMQRGLRRQQRHEHGLAQANRRWELAVVGAGLGLFELDTATGMVSLDAHAAALYGLPREAVTLPGQALLEQVTPEDRVRARQTFREAAASHALFRLRLQRQAQAQGAGCHLETVGSLTDDLDGRAPRITGVVRDVTQEMAQAQMAVERDAAERVASAQRHFLSRLSHELRTPLNAILGFAQLLSIDRRHPLPPSQQQQVTWILDAGHQLLALIEDVLDLSKVEAGEISISPCEVDPAAVVQASLVLVEPARQQHDVRIINRLPEPAPHVWADPQRLQQVFVNLLSNACKYNRPGGHITIDATVRDGLVCIDVADNGIGLTPEDARELFQPFRRVAAVSARVEGTGLGLYIVKQLVERMGGSVSVCSEADVGSRFTVCLPAAPAATGSVAD